MGRTVIAEDGIEHYGAALAKKKRFVVGLIFGQEISSAKSCVVHLARTPEPAVENDEEESNAEVQEKRDDIDEELVLDHARQVMRALPGGVTILGLFVVSSSDPFQNANTSQRIRKLLTSIDLIVAKSCLTLRQQLTCERVALHICHTTLKYTCKTIDIASPVASPKPADWKFVSAAGSPWIELTCTLNVEFFIALSDTESSGTLRHQIEAGLDLYGKAVKQCICLIDGKKPDDDDFIDAPSPAARGQKKAKAPSSQERMKTVNVQVLIPEPEFRKEKFQFSSDLRFGGQMCIKAYAHGKCTVKEACQIIREDVLRSLWARCDMHCDSLVGDEQRGQPDVRAVLHEPPRRVLALLPFSPISVSDYLFPGEGPADSLASLSDLLDLGALLEGDVQDYWEAAAEVHETDLESASAPETTPVVTRKVATASATSSSTAILISGLVALLAIILSYLAVQILRP